MIFLVFKVYTTLANGQRHSLAIIYVISSAVSLRSSCQIVVEFPFPNTVSNLTLSSPFINVLSRMYIILAGPFKGDRGAGTGRTVVMNVSYQHVVIIRFWFLRVFLTSNKAPATWWVILCRWRTSDMPLENRDRQRKPPKAGGEGFWVQSSATWWVLREISNHTTKAAPKQRHNSFHCMKVQFGVIIGVLGVI